MIPLVTKGNGKGGVWGGVARVRYEKMKEWRETTPLAPCLRRGDGRGKIFITVWTPDRARGDKQERRKLKPKLIWSAI